MQEGAVTRAEAQQLAEELARECVSAWRDTDEPFMDNFVARYILRALDRALPPDQPDATVDARIRDLLLRADPERGESLVRWLERRLAITRAEREVVEAAFRWEAGREARRAMGEAPENYTTTHSRGLGETVGRLRALRESARAEECGAMIRTLTQDEEDMRDFPDGATQRNAACTLPRGHEGKHRGDLGEWEWE